MMLVVFRQLTVVVVLSLLTAGCATLFRGNRQSVKFVTDPQGAELVINGKTYHTPAHVLLKRNQPYDITLTAAGYQGVKFKLKANWDAGGPLAVFADALIPGGSLLFVFDTLTGADRKFHDIATIKLSPDMTVGDELVEVFEYKGQLLVKAEYDAARGITQKPEKPTEYADAPAAQVAP